MYYNGLKFSVSPFSIYDNEYNKSITDIRNRRNSIFSYSKDGIEDALQKSILHSINTEKGYELLPTLLNHFPDLIQSKIKFKDDSYNSEFIKDQIHFNLVLNQYRIDFDKIDSSLNQIETIASFDKQCFYQGFYLMLYKNYFHVISNLVNYSDLPSSELYFDITKDLKKFNDYITELKNFRPNLISNYDFKKNYVNAFLKSFNTTKIDDAIQKAEGLKKYARNEFKSTLKNFLKIIFNIKDNITANHRNKIFRELYIELLFPLTGKVYVQNLKTDRALTKEIKTFFADF